MREWTRANEWWLKWVAVVAIGGGLLAFNLLITTRKDATKTEEALSTFILFSIGLGVSYYFGKKSMSDAAAAIVKPQARGAARRLRRLGYGVQTSLELIELHRRAARDAATADGSVPMDQVDLTLKTLQIEMEASMGTVVDALNDWREFDPDILVDLDDESEAP